MTKLKLFAALLAGIAFSLPAAAKMYKWVDDKGVTHYGETIPPEYADKDRTELDKSGRAVKKQEVLTPEERRAGEEAAARKRADEEAALEQKRRDKALVNTYSNSDEIDLARNRNLQQVEARIRSIGSQLKMAEGNLAGLMEILSADVVAVSDGGGLRTSARRPVYGANRVARFAIGIARKEPIARVELVDVNRQPGFLFVSRSGRIMTAAVLEEVDGKISAVYAVRNPQKLRHIGRDGRLPASSQTSTLSE